mgnify:CR=1 FL=1
MLLKGLIIETPPLDIYAQMAADEYFCETMPRKYLLRFYNWQSGGVTFGYSQRYSTVITRLKKEKKEGLPPVRRPTGGGIVYHENDLTFSFIFHYPCVTFNPRRIYFLLHNAIKREYGKSVLNFDISSDKTENYNTNFPAMECFKKPVEMDLLSEGKKALGGALRKFADYMLYQASLQTAEVRKNADFHKKTIAKAFANEFNIIWEEKKMAGEEMEKVLQIKEMKYMTKSWNRRI